MKKNIIFLTLLTCLIEFLYCEDKTYKSLLIYKNNLYPILNNKNNILDEEFIDNINYLYSDYNGVYIGNILNNDNKIIYNKPVRQITIIENKNDIVKVLLESNNYILNTKLYELKVAKDNINYLKYQPSDFNEKNVPEKIGKYFFDIDGNFIFASLRYDFTPCEDNLCNNLLRYDLNFKNEKLLLSNMPDDYEWICLGKGLLLGHYGYKEAMMTVILDYDGNILQVYPNLVYTTGSLTPDNKYLILSGALYAYNLNKNNISYKIESNGLLLFEINEDVKKSLIKKSKSLVNIKELVRDKNNEMIRSDDNKIEKGIFKNEFKLNNSIDIVLINDFSKILAYTPSVSNLRFRETPDLNGKFIRSLNQNEKLELIEKGKEDTINGTKGNWVKVKTEKGEVGWCFDAYLKEVK